MVSGRIVRLPAGCVGCLVLAIVVISVCIFRYGEAGLAMNVHLHEEASANADGAMKYGRVCIAKRACALSF
jgi:hypothetical protein